MSKLLEKRTRAMKQANKVAQRLYNRLGDSSDAELCYLTSRLFDIIDRALPKKKKP